MKVSILGAGAIGSMLGGLIRYHRPDIDVLLVVRGEHGRVITQRGAVRLEGPWGTRDVAVATTADVAEIAGSDLVLFSVKSQATAEAIAGAAPYLGDAVVVSIQNGINEDLLLRHVPPQRLVMGMTATNMAVLEPGTVSLQLDGASVVGPAPGGANAAAATRAAELLRHTGLQFEEHPNVLGVRYTKLVFNVLGYVACLSASNFITQAVCHREWRRTVGLPLLGECAATFAAAGIELAKIPGRPDVGSLRRLLRMLDVPVAGSVVAMVARRIYNRKPIVFSLYQDLLHGKPTEVDHINGHVVRLARAQDLAAPLNELAVQMCHDLERRGPAPFVDRREVIERFAAAARQPWPAGAR
jgi:2-dehydropantoate 2-reductase